ncbi:Response regulator receiver domain-containing protein [Flavobacterium gillisiae]|jgi:CheY-like chemotaxis protein|uniref:Response regulator receiver domain-containing protein n=1 Tax=Flavobacterium gillisiae TaxID=150146 RepID=A0A1H4A4W0_9FLAO|nr:response regulator [Flavobacterium gillisiae]SEA30592.1 Response regulator receiver domain-containing protein [Flavobacterium gillisiae]|tara:strand:+ start:6202 stop:6654 length:453 start_codon:yes stop_codon:yes gene_type:complete
MISHKDSMHILIADDDEDDRTFFSEAMMELKMNNKLTLFNDGKDLMDYLSNPDIIMPHILFLDLNMPYMSGFECLKVIRADVRFKDVSIAIYSTSSSEKDIEETFVEGANIYIKKPNDFAKLKKVIKDVLNINWQFHSSGLNKETFFFSI